MVIGEEVLWKRGMHTYVKREQNEEESKKALKFAYILLYSCEREKKELAFAIHTFSCSICALSSIEGGSDIHRESKSDCRQSLCIAYATDTLCLPSSSFPLCLY